jgi:hypothetical protein
MEKSKRLVINVVSKIIVLEQLSSELDSLGVSIDRLDAMPYDLLDDVLDALDFSPENPLPDFLMDEDQPPVSNRDNLREYFSTNYRQKSAEELVEELLIIKADMERSGDQFDIRAYIPD